MKPWESHLQFHFLLASLLLQMFLMIPGVVVRNAVAAEPMLPARQLLHAGMESEAEVNNPTLSTGRIPGWEKGAALRRSPSAQVRFEPGKTGNAVRFLPGDRGSRAVAVFGAENFDFSDVRDRGGKLEFWLKFNSDPHRYSGNKMILRTEPYPPVLTIELYGSRPFMAAEFYGTNFRNGSNPKTNYRFLAYTEGWDAWYRWKAGEWHKVTLAWQRNGDSSAAEMHLFIDDSQEGCPPNKCNDTNGFLPDPGTWREVVVGNFSGTFAIDHTLDELLSFGAAPADPIETPTP